MDFPLTSVSLILTGLYSSTFNTDHSFRLLLAYFHSVSTLNYLRGMIAGGVADLHSAPSWSLDNVLKEETRNEYSNIIRT